MKEIGDLLILFGFDSKPSIGRMKNSSWTQCTDAPKIWIDQVTADWKGFPFQIIKVNDLCFCALGEFTPSNFQSLNSLQKGVAKQTGSFLVFAWNESDSTWHAWTDRFGTLHAYYAWDGHRGALGTFSPAVTEAASRRVLDWEALAGWFSFGFFPADRTYYTDLHVLRPASHYIFDHSGRLLTQERYWNWKYQPDENRSYEDTIHEFGSLFNEVMSDALGVGRVAVPVSGGLDSRSTVAGISPEKSRDGRIWSYSYGYSDDSAEISIARQVSNARELPFQAYTIQPYLFDQIDRLLAYTEGFQDITQARQMFVRDEIAAHADSLIAALWGDVWLDEMGLSAYPNAADDDVLRRTLKKIRKKNGWLVHHLVLPHIGSDAIESLLEGFVQAELRQLRDIDDPDFRVKAFKTEQWSFRWSIPPTRVYQSAAWPRKIFYDTRLTDFFATVPVSFLSGRRLQIDYLKRFAPDLAWIAWQVYDANLYQYQYFDTWLLPKRALKKAWRVVRKHKVLERNWEVQFLCPQGRAGLDQWLLHPGLRLYEFVAPDHVRALLDDVFSSPKADNGYTVSMLLTFSTWLEKFG